MQLTKMSVSLRNHPYLLSVFVFFSAFVSALTDTSSIWMHSNQYALLVDYSYSIWSNYRSEVHFKTYGCSGIIIFYCVWEVGGGVGGGGVVLCFLGWSVWKVIISTCFCVFGTVLFVGVVGGDGRLYVLGGRQFVCYALLCVYVCVCVCVCVCYNGKNFIV